MGKSPKFMVFHLRELIYTLVFIILGIILIVALVLMFRGKSSSTETSVTPNVSQNMYTAGVYTSQVTLNGNPMDIKVSIDKNHINSITIDNVSNTIATMYPLIQPAFEDIAKQIVATQSLNNLQIPEDKQYTYTVLVDAIKDVVNDAKK